MESKIGRPAIANKYRLTIFFGIAAMVIIFGATFVMSHILGRIAENNLVRLAENSITSDAVQILSAIRRTELPQGMVSSGPISGAGSPNGSAINREWLKGSKELSKTLPTLVEKYSIVSLSLYDPTGQTVWSTDPNAKRGVDQANPIFSVALAGSISSSFLQDKEVGDFGGARQSISVVQTYLPVRSVSSSDVSGVLEIERNVTADVPFLIDATKTATLKVTGATMGGLFLVLIFVVVVADGAVSRSRKREGWTEIRLAEKEQSEAALQESNYRLEEALDELKETQQQAIRQERLRALGQMASGIAHDFNNALTPILGFSQMLAAHPERLEDTDSAMSQIQIINTAARTAAASVARLREFYRSRLQDDVFLPFDLNELVEEAISMTQARWKDEAQAKGVTVTVATILQEVPPICGNASEIRGALINLILNAVDAMTDGGELTIATRVDASHVACVVTDQGIGMTEEVRRRCIDPFFTTKGPQLGTGMGLPMVYGAIQRHDGKIEIESEVGRGTSITMLLPLSTPEAAETTGGNSADGTANPLHLLVVDDEPMVLNLVAAFLKSEGHTVVVAANGREGLERFCAGSFDLVLTDRAMPEMSGDQLASAIKERDPQTPIIMLTGFGANMLSGREIPADVDLIMSKPFDLSELRQAVADLTGATVSMNADPQIAART